MSKLRFCALLLSVLLLTSLNLLAGEITKPPVPKTPYKNIIVFMADGCGSTHTTLARWYKGGLLNLDRMHLAGVQTFGAESSITDSAPAATAFACGVKTSDKMLGVLPDKTTVPGVIGSDSETQIDGENLTQVLQGRGYRYVRTATEMNAAAGEKLWGMFAADAMAWRMARFNSRVSPVRCT